MAALLAVFCCGQVLAQEPTVKLIVETGDWVSIQREGRKFSYFADLGGAPKRLFIDGMADNALQYRYTTQLAMSDDGPSFDLTGHKVTSAWKTVHVTQEGKQSVLDIYYEDNGVAIYPLRSGVQLPVQLTREALRAAIQRIVPEDKKHWLEKSKSCFAHDGRFITNEAGNGSSCYRYTSQEQFNFKGADGKDYEIIIGHPGGC